MPRSRRNYRKENLKRRYSMTQDTYLALYQSQRGLCAICRTHHPILSIDHCHASLSLRGLLCSRCNLGLGLFDDNINTLKSAIRYLRVPR